MKNNWNKIVDAVMPILGILTIVAAWAIVSWLSPEIMPGFSEIYARFIRLMEKPIMHISLWMHILYSLRRVVIALLCAWVLGVSFGVLIGWNRTAGALLGSVFTMLRPIPPLAWVPLITVWCGIGEFPKILIVFIGAFCAVVVNVRAGMKATEPLYLNVGRVFNANRSQLLFEFAIPSALPSIFAGIRTSTSVAWAVVLAAEMLGAKSGIGFLISRGMESTDTPLVIICMVAIAIVGALLAALVMSIEKAVCKW